MLIQPQTPCVTLELIKDEASVWIINMHKLVCLYFLRGGGGKLVYMTDTIRNISQHDGVYNFEATILEKIRVPISIIALPVW